MFTQNPLILSRLFLASVGTQMYAYHTDRLPTSGSAIIISNHRSFMDAPVLMAALSRTIRFACHHYMGEVPVMRDVVQQMGCFPLASPEQRQEAFFQQASHLLQSQQAVGIFPEGASSMVQRTDPKQIQRFHRGFAHLALRSSVPDLAVIPVAIASQEEASDAAFPLQMLSVFDPSEPLFAKGGWHPLVIYRRLHVFVGRPRWITSEEREQYQSRYAKSVISDLSQYCQQEIQELLHQAAW